MQTRWTIPLAAHLGIHDASKPQFAALAEGLDVTSQVAFAREQGFEAVSDNVFVGRDAGEQRTLAAALDRFGMRFTSLTLHAPGESPGHWTAPEYAEEHRVARALEAAKLVSASAITIVVMDDGSPRREQLDRAVGNLGIAARAAERAGLSLSLEAVSALRLPGVLIERIADAVDVVRAVDSPGLGITFDSCHVALTGDDPASELLRAGPYLRAVQFADVPGRVEPGAGVLDWRGIVDVLHGTGWTGATELECFAADGEGAAAERAVLRRVDAVFGYEGDRAVTARR